MENNYAWHGSAPNAEQYEIAMNDLKGGQIMAQETRNAYGEALAELVKEKMKMS